MRRGTIAIVLLSLMGALQLIAAAEAATTRPIVYGKTQWEWAGPEGEREIRSWGGLYASHGDDARQLTDQAGDREPNVSRDGSVIAFVRDSDIYAINSDGSDERQLTNGPGLDERPQISPNGRYILFDRRDSGEGPRDLYRVDLAGGWPRALTAGPEDDREAAFSPTGLILFVRGLPAPKSGGVNDELFTVHPAGFDQVRLTHTPQDELNPRFYARGIVFNRRMSARGGPAAIYTMRRDGTGAKSLLSGKAGVAVQAVSPNGRLLVFSSRGGGTWRKRLVGPTRRSLRPHRFAGWSADHLVFSPDGRRVAGAFANTSSEVSPFYVLTSIDVFSGVGGRSLETWEAEAPDPVQTAIGSVVGW